MPTTSTELPTHKTLNPVGWGYVEDALSDAEHQRLVRLYRQFFTSTDRERCAPPLPQSVCLPRSRVSVPQSLHEHVLTDHDTRLGHAVGRSFRDLAQLRSGQISYATDAVAIPRCQSELLRVLEWADQHRYAIIPFGGGSSVVGGINAENMDGYDGVVTLSLRGLDRILDIDTVSATVHAEAGILGPDLDAALKPHGLAIRHYPQSYFHSTAGGWVATRGAGHFSTLLAKIEDRVQALGITLPNGTRVETRPLPASSIGPDPNRLWLGSEGTLGVITDVALRCVRLPTRRVHVGLRFDSFESAMECARTLIQSGCHPTQLRILDPVEHQLSAVFSGHAASGALMVAGFESAGASLADAYFRSMATKMGGTIHDNGGQRGVSDWRNTFFRQPYLRDALLDYAVMADTFETAVPWAAAKTAYHAVREQTAAVLRKVCGGGVVSCRVTHAYSDGCSLYFAFFGAGRRGTLVEQWWQIKAAVSDTVMACGGTISHHHAMGRDHRRWARQEIPPTFRTAVRAVKRDLDPNDVLNPGLWFND